MKEETIKFIMNKLKEPWQTKMNNTCVLIHSVMSNSVMPWTACQAPLFCLQGSSVHWDSPGRNTGVGCHAFLQGIFPTQGSNPGLLHCRQILYCLSHKGSPRKLHWVDYTFSRGSSGCRNPTNRGLLHCGWILYQCNYQGSPI